MRELSISLSVQDLDRSVEFYNALGFQVVDGGHVSARFPDSDQAAWRVMALDEFKIGLFRGMFDKNMLSLHGVDVVEVRSILQSRGFDVPEGATLIDPDGNTILFE